MKISWTMSFALVAGTLAMAAMLGSGCTHSDTPADVVGDAKRASGLEGAITFETDGGPLDAPAVPGRQLTLEQAVREALRTSPEIQVALAHVREAEADLSQEQLLPNPVVSVIFRSPTAGGKPAIEAGLAADLVALLQRPGRIAAADNRLRGASIDAVSAVLGILADAQERYADVQALDALMPVLEERRQLTVHLLDLARARLKAGEATQLDVTVADGQRVDVEVDIAQRQVERQQVRLQLARIIGRPSGPINWTVTPWEPPPRSAAPESAWVEAGLTHRPEVELRNYELAALYAEVGLSRLEVFQSSGLGVDAQRDPDWQVGPAYNGPIPIFDWGQARLAKARAKVVGARHELTRVRRDIVRDVRQAYTTFNAALDSLSRVRDELVPLARRRREQTEAAYRAGQTDITAVVLADQELVAARERLIELERQASSALIQLQRAVGGPVAARDADRGSPAANPAAGDLGTTRGPATTSTGPTKE